MSNYAIYQPKGKAGEYAQWACNFYNGCTNGCVYCYLRKGILAKTMGGSTPTLKKCFKDEADALRIFEKELLQNIDEIRKHGIFFSFTTDPLLPETIGLTIQAVDICVKNSVPVKLLTKRADFAERYFKRLCSESALREQILHIAHTALVAFGFSLTGSDDMESGASTNRERIEAMKILFDGGYKTFASIEPVINFVDSFIMIRETIDFCNLYKIGLLSGMKPHPAHLNQFVKDVKEVAEQNGALIYWKESITKITGPIESYTTVDRDFNLFGK